MIYARNIIFQHPKRDKRSEEVNADIINSIKSEFLIQYLSYFGHFLDIIPLLFSEKNATAFELYGL